jgi:DNA-binding LytR/AlgR family response regulator
MLKVAIVDDDKRLAHKTEEYLLSYQKNTIETEVYFSPVKLLKAMEENTYDIYVLDIEMPDMNGVELATAIRERDQQAMIIFLTSHTGYMKDVFKVHTFDYLVKPVTQEKVHELLERALNYLNQDTFTIRFNARTRTIPQMNIFYIEKKVRKVYI